MADAEELIVRIKADITSLQAGLKDAASATKQSTAEMKSSLEGVKASFESVRGAAELMGVGLSIGALVEFTKNALEAADNIYIMGQRTGFAADTLSKLNIPLKQGGSSVDEFSNSMKFMSRNIETASPQVIAAFDQLGLSITKLKQLTPEEQFYAIANAMAGIKDQGKFTADGMAIFGRAFASIAPLIKEASGNMAEFIGKMDGLTTEEIDKVHELDDKWTAFWEHMKIGAVEATVAVADFFDAWNKDNKSTTPGTDDMGFPLSSRFGTDGHGGPLLSKEQRTATRSISPELDSALGKSLSSSTGTDKNAKGNNNDLGGTPSKEDIQTLGDYIDKLQLEANELALGKQAYAEYKAEVAAATAVGKDWADLTDDEIDKIDAATDAIEAQKQAQADLTKQKEKDTQVQAQMEHEISSSLASIALNYKSLGQTISDTLKKIAQQIIEQKLTNPFVSGLDTLLGGSGSGGSGKNTDGTSLFSSFLPKFAAGGSVSGNSPIIVGENGPELFIPGGSGSVVPNSARGSGGATVYQTINLSPGLAETVNASIMQAAPRIAAAAHAGVMQSLQKGGAESRIVGKRS